MSDPFQFRNLYCKTWFVQLSKLIFCRLIECFLYLTIRYITNKITLMIHTNDDTLKKYLTIFILWVVILYLSLGTHRSILIINVLFLSLLVLILCVSLSFLYALDISFYIILIPVFYLSVFHRLSLSPFSWFSCSNPFFTSRLSPHSCML